MIKQQQKTKSTHESSDDQPTTPERKRMLISFVVWILYNAVRISLLLTLLITLPSLLPQFSSSQAYLHMQQVISLWNQDVIINIKIQKEEICGQGWEDPWGEWPGNVEGCSCTVNAGAYSYEVVFIGKCTAEEISAGCKIVNANNAVGYKYWGADQHICIQRLHGYNFYSTKTSIITSLNLKQCPTTGPGSTTSPYLMDFISTIPCPITGLSNSEKLEEIINPGWSVERGNSYPMAGVRIVVGNVCSWLNEEQADTGMGQDYILMAGNRGQCTQGDWRATTISTMDQLSLFASNPPILSILSSLPASAPPSPRHNTSLLFYSYPPWTYQCRMSSQFNLITARTNFEFTPVMGTIVKYIVICAGVFGGIFLMIAWQIWRRIGAWRMGAGGDAREWIQMRERKRLYPYLQKPDITGEIIKFGMVLLLCATGLVTVGIYHSYLAGLYSWYLNSYACTNASLSVWISYYLEEMSQRMKSAMEEIGGIIAVIVTEIAYWVWRRNKGDLTQEDEKEEMKQMKQMKNRQRMEQQNESESNITDQKDIFGEKSCIQQTQEILMEQQLHLQSSMYTSIPVANQRRHPMIMTQLISDTISQLSH